MPCTLFLVGHFGLEFHLAAQMVIVPKRKATLPLSCSPAPSLIKEGPHQLPPLQVTKQVLETCIKKHGLFLLAAVPGKYNSTGTFWNPGSRG